MVNRLIGENSPYLLQHATNPVDWYPWGKEALNKALIEEKPIFLSIGYAACHWCHVMAHDSFEDPEIATIMNQNFVNIKVDREERPDLDDIYMSAVVTMIGQGGWPMSVFLTPDGYPFYGGTYFPPERRYNIPSFREVLLGISQAWKENRPRIIQAGMELKDRLYQSTQEDRKFNSKQLTKGYLDQVVLHLAQSYDWKNGGWGRAPKFPQPMVIEFLLRRASSGDKLALDIAKHALECMAAGGMHDILGGGFARYSTDDQWLVPHFEKMLYDNAQLALVYLYGFLLSGNQDFCDVCTSTLDFLTREMLQADGGFSSSLDADTAGQEGAFYLWTIKDIHEALGSGQDADLIIEAYGLSESGNYEGKNILRMQYSMEALASRLSLPVDYIRARLSESNKNLLLARSRRIRPDLDDKVLVSWNSLAMVAFAEAGKYLGRIDYIEIARRNADFVLENMIVGGQLKRSWRNGKAVHNAYLEDYAGLCYGLLTLYQVLPDVKYFTNAKELAHRIIDNFKALDGCFYDAMDGDDELIARPRNLFDNATPSGSALSILALGLLFAMDGGLGVDLFGLCFALVFVDLVRYPLGFGKWLCAAYDFINRPFEIAIITPGTSATRGSAKKMISKLWSTYRPNVVISFSEFPPPPGAPALLHNREPINNLPTAYVCKDFYCKRPVTTPEELLEQISIGASTGE